VKVRALASGPPHWIWNTDTEVPSLPECSRSRPRTAARQSAEQDAPLALPP
jgi:hypothetical protein